MKTISLATWVPLMTLGVVGCTIVTNPPPTSTTAPPPPPPTAAPAATPAPAATATADPTPTTTATAKAPPTMKLPGGKTNPPPRSRTGMLGHVTLRIPIVAADTIFGGKEKKEGALEGLVYLLPRTMTTLPDLSTQKPVAKLYTDSLNIASQDFKTGFPEVTRRFEYFVIHYAGSFAVTVAGTYTFKLISDDGSRLRIDNIPVINNDGVHEATEKTGVLALAPGNHTISLDYFQAQKNVALQLMVTGPDGQERPWSPKL
jgi:PA14 domain